MIHGILCNSIVIILLNPIYDYVIAMLLLIDLSKNKYIHVNVAVRDKFIMIDFETDAHWKNKLQSSFPKKLYNESSAKWGQVQRVITRWIQIQSKNEYLKHNKQDLISQLVQS